MDASKSLPESEECSSSESGWTTYIVSPEVEHDQAENEEDEDGSIGHQVFMKQEEADSDDSMASDASSGPSDPRYSYGYLTRSRGFGKKDQKKSQQEEKKKKQMKGEKDKAGNRGKGVGRLKKF